MPGWLIQASLFGGRLGALPAAAGKALSPHLAGLRGVSDARGAVVQRFAHGEALRLPAQLTNFGHGAGQSLPPLVLQKMESFFGTSFADVRVHVGPQAASIGALAFTQGANLYFAPGQYNPHSPQGQQLLGHELTHVVQQRAGRVRNPFGGGIAVVNDRTLEDEANRMGIKAAAHQLPVQMKKAGGLPPGLVRGVGAGGVLQPVKFKASTAPKALRYRSLVGAKRLTHVSHMKSKQYNLNRGRQLNVRHIIPHSDLQAWIMQARKAGNALSVAGQMRRQLHALLISFGDAINAAAWLNCYTNYEANAPALQSMLLFAPAGVTQAWGGNRMASGESIPWPRRVELGHPKPLRCGTRGRRLARYCIYQ